MLENMLTRYFPDGPGVKAPLPNQGAWVPYLVEKLRSYNSAGQPKDFKDMYMDLIVPFLTRDLGMIQFNVIES